MPATASPKSVVAPSAKSKSSAERPGSKSTRICIFGMGYVGCVSGACLASLGHRVVGVEPNRTKVDLINSGQSPIVEDGLSQLIETGVREGSFRASDDWRSAIAESELALVCVGTPSRSNGSIDLGYVRRVCEQIGQALRGRRDFFTVVIRSTIVPGSVEGTLVPILERESGLKAGVDFGVCMNPEFLREGTSVRDFHDPPKTVIGELNAKSGEALAALYSGLPGPQIRTTIPVAEMVKYVDNAFHALKVAFANEVGSLCKELKVDSHQVMAIFCQDTKLNLSPYYLKPGFAFGGSCLPKDLRALTHEARSLDLDLPLLKSILDSNKVQILKVIRKLMEFKGRSLGFLGLSFKGGTDDLRESPIVEVIEAMLGKGFAVRIYDRHVSLARLMGANKEYIEKEIPHISRLMCGTAEELVSSSEVIVVSNRSPEFPEALTRCGPHQTVIDLVRIVEGLAKGNYYGICW
jgi:GDP-mannose 6-dehydrogenase